MRSWDTASMDVRPGHPEVICSAAEGRAILIDLPAGDRLDEHQVHEASWITVTAGLVEIGEAGGDQARGGPGLLVHLAANERREVRAVADSRVLLILTPWPGEGHPSEHARQDPSAIGYPRE